MMVIHVGVTSYWIFSNALFDISNKIDISEENITNLEKSLDKSYIMCYIYNGR